jgi:hypothetical protein
MKPRELAVQAIDQAFVNVLQNIYDQFYLSLATHQEAQARERRDRGLILAKTVHEEMLGVVEKHWPQETV